jgi:tetratricopeptide (TPR) repeat protein
VQLGLYFSALDDNARAIAAFHKALVISPDYIPAIVRLSEQYLHPSAGQSFSLVKDASEARRGAVDLAAGMLSSFTKGVGWDVPEAWYLLAKAVGMQGRKERQQVCLTYALGLVEGQPIRDLRVALGYAL